MRLNRQGIVIAGILIVLILSMLTRRSQRHLNHPRLYSDRLRNRLSEEARDGPLSEILSQKTQLYSDSFYKEHNYGGIISQFGADETLFLSTRAISTAYAATVLPLVAESYEKLGDHQNASAYFVLAAKDLGTTQPGAPTVDEYLLKAKNLNPENRDIERVRSELMRRPGYAAAKKSETEKNEAFMQTEAKMQEGAEGPDGEAFKAEFAKLYKLYYRGDMKGFIAQFQAHPSFYARMDEVSKMRLLRLAPGIGDAYYRLKDKKNAAHYFALAAKIQKEVSPKDPRFERYLNRASHLDPDSDEVKALRAAFPAPEM